MLMKKAICAMFVAFIFGVALWALILPDRAYSHLERRNLEQAPALTARGVFDGSFEAAAKQKEP